MKDILFRGESVETGDFVYGLLFLSHGTGDYFITFCDSWNPTYRDPDSGNSTEYVKIKTETIGQYTGLKDKNDKKIFEGDIVKGYNNFYIVRFGLNPDIGVVCFYLEMVKSDEWTYQLKVNSNVEIIGNIHDNPELLEGE